MYLQIAGGRKNEKYILPDDGTFKPFIVRVVAKQRKTTEELYSLAKSRNLKLTKNQRLDTGRPTQLLGSTNFAGINMF